MNLGALKIKNRSRGIEQSLLYNTVGALFNRTQTIHYNQGIGYRPQRSYYDAIMVTKLRRNDGKRFTAPKDGSTNQPTVFTMLAKMERAKEQQKVSAFQPAAYKPPNQDDTSAFMDLEAGDDQGWTIVVSNPKKQKKHLADVTLVPDILYDENVNETMVPAADMAHFWPIDIKIRLKENEAVNVPTLLSCILNTFQGNDVHTVIVPNDYKNHYDVEHFITKSTLIPTGEAELRRYLSSIRTFKESIIVQAVFMTKSLFYQLVDKRQSYYNEINVDVRLNWLRADATAVTGFFIRLAAKPETMFDHQCRVQRTLLQEGVSPPIQLAIFDLHYHQGKGKKVKEHKTRVYSVRAKEEDVFEVTGQLREACLSSPVYHFVPWDEYTCLEEEDKICIINGQNQFLKEYCQLIINGFEREPPGATMWMIPASKTNSGSANSTTDSATPVDVNSTPTPMNVDLKPNEETQEGKDSNPLAQSIAGLTENWDDTTSPVEVTAPPQATPRSASPSTDAASDAIMRDNPKIPRTPPKQTQSDREEKRRCLESSNQEDTTDLDPQSFDYRYSQSISDYLRTVPSGDGQTLFDAVFDVEYGRREVLGLSRKLKEMQAYIRVIHREIARHMNVTARELIYPDQNPQNPASCHNTLPWQGFNLKNNFSVKQGHLRTIGSMDTTTTNFEYRTDGKKYYTEKLLPPSIDQSDSSSHITTITTIKPESAMKRQYTPVYGRHGTAVCYQKQPPSLDETVSSSTITDSSSSEELIASLRTELANVRCQQQQLAADVVILTKQNGADTQAMQHVKPSALAQFERHILEQTEQYITRTVTASHKELDEKFEQRSTKTETSFQQALSQATTVMKHKLDSSKTMYTDTLSALKDMMIAQQQVQQQIQQQMQQQQQQMQEQQSQNLELHRAMMERLKDTDHSLSIMQQSTPLYSAQASLLAEQMDITNTITAESQGQSTVPPSSHSSSTLNIHATNSDVPYPPFPTGRHTQTLLTTGTNGTIKLSSCNKTKGQSSRPHGGSTKDQ